MGALGSLELADLRARLDSREISSREVVEDCLETIRTRGDLNAFVSVSESSALRQADAADARLAAGDRSPLLGVPVSIKDMILVRGERNTCASRILETFVAPYDATVVERLKAAGAIVVGKTNMDEFAMGSSSESSCFGPVRNPWNPEKVAGGSSGGSAVAVAARMTPLSLGTDTGGSVRQPAALCNVVGLKPTYGRVSRYGVVAYASSLDQVGPFARNTRDCAAIAQVLFGHDPRDSTSVEREVPNLLAGIEEGVKGLRIGIPREYFVSGVAPAVDAAVKASIERLEKLGAEIVDISLPHTESALAVYYVLAPAEASSNLSRYDGIRYGHRSKKAGDLAEIYSMSRSEGFGKEVKRRIMIGTFVLSSGYYDAYYQRAQKVRRLIARDFESVFSNQCDVIACPTSPTTAFGIGEKTSNPIEMYLSDVFTIPVNLAGLPAISVPCGFDADGLPIGLQLIGKTWDEQTLLRAAFAHEAEGDWHTKIPGGRHGV